MRRLPRPPLGHHLVLDAHRAAARDWSAPHQHRLLNACGLDTWAAACAAGVPAHAVRCVCEAPMPSLSHLMWVCPAMADLRQRYRITLPRTAAEDRLLCATCPPKPPAPRYSGSAPARRLRQVVGAALASRSTVHMATDGSAVDGLAAWAVQVEGSWRSG